MCKQQKILCVRNVGSSPDTSIGELRPSGCIWRSIVILLLKHRYTVQKRCTVCYKLIIFVFWMLWGCNCKKKVNCMVNNLSSSSHDIVFFPFHKKNIVHTKINRITVYLCGTWVVRPFSSTSASSTNTSNITCLPPIRSCVGAE